MTLAHGTDWLESARLMLRRIAPDDLAVLRKEDGVLIGHCGLTENVPAQGRTAKWT